MTRRLASAILDHLTRYGPSTAQELHAALYARGVTTAQTPTSVRNTLCSLRIAFERADERWDLTTRALTGVTLTIRPRSVLRDQVLWVHDDLAPFDGLLPSGDVPLARGGVVRRGGSDVRTFLGPEGWLPTIDAGGLVGLRWNGEALEVSTVDPKDLPDEAALGALRDLLCLHRGGLPAYGGQGPTVSEILLSALREAPDMFTGPLPPLSELFPLPPRVVHETTQWEMHEPGERVTLHLPTRVLEELSRRAGLLGESVPTHAAILLGAAVDRAQRVPVRDDRDYAYSRGYDDYRYDSAPYADDIVRPLWGSR